MASSAKKTASKETAGIRAKKAAGIKAGTGVRSGVSVKPNSASAKKRRAASAALKGKAGSNYEEIVSIIAIAVCLLLVLSLYTESGTGFLGGYINTFLIGMIGFGAYVLPFFVIVMCVGVIFLKDTVIDKPRMVMYTVLFFIMISFVHVINFKENSAVYVDIWEYIKGSYTSASYKNGGLFGALFGNCFIKLFGIAGTYVLLATAGIILLILITGKSLFSAIRTLKIKAEDMVERSRYRAQYDYDYDDEEDEEEFYDKSFVAEPVDEAEAYDVPEPKTKRKDYTEDYGFEKRRTVFDHVIEEEEEPSEETEVDLINDTLKRGYKRNYSAMAADSSEEVDEDESEKLILFSDTPAKKKTGLPKKIDETGWKEWEETTLSQMDEYFNLKVNGVGIIDETQETASGEKPNPVSAFIEQSAAAKSKKAEQAIVQKMQSDIEEEILTSGEYEDMEYIFPPIDLLNENKTVMSMSSRTQIYENSKKLEETLKSFGVEAKVVEVSKGPTVTRYELSPGAGVKVSRISGLADDLALNLAAVGIRIEAPIPGKAVVGIEIPNKEVQPVYLREVISDQQFQKHPSRLALAMGKDISGRTVVADIAKMPHLLIAGATGSGKSICINTLITSIIYKARPDEVKLLMVDPKVVELSIYNGIPHLLIPVVTDPKKAASALNWAVAEMINRYKLFAEASVRDMKGYNAWKTEREEKDLLPQIVIIIDELADLMMAAPGEVEDSICRLAQMARAAGIHLIIATQRPSVDVITGLIKANIPSRLAFAVSSGTDSRTILDSVGAEKLLGQGDMLFNPVGLGRPQRIQGAFISDKEVEAIVSFLKDGVEPEYDLEMIEKITSNVKDAELAERDELLEEAVEFILEKDKASVSMLQRRFRVGYNRAARLMEELEVRGIVGPEDGSKPRKIHMNAEEWQQYREKYL